MKSKNINRIIFLLSFFVLMLAACEKDNDNPQKEEKPSVVETKGVYILNEGNFNWNNASLSFYNADTKTIQNDLFYETNQKKLGDVANSMLLIDTLAYIVVNNSGKIEIFNTKTLQSVQTVSDLVSPRYMQPVNAQKAYVSDLYSSSVQVFDFEKREITKTIPSFKSTENMVLSGNYVFVANWSYGSKIQVIDTRKDEIVREIDVTYEPNSMILDRNNKIWVLSSGGYMNQETPALTCINPETFATEKTLLFDSINCSPTRLVANPTKDKLFFINKNIYQFDIYSNTLPKDAFILAEKQIFYAMNVNPKNGEIFVSDALDYVQNGIIYRFDKDGILLDKFEAGIIPGFFCFKQ